MSSDAQDERRHVKESDDHKHRRKKNSKDDKQQVKPKIISFCRLSVSANVLLYLMTGLLSQSMLHNFIRRLLLLYSAVRCTRLGVCNYLDKQQDKTNEA